MHRIQTGDNETTLAVSAGLHDRVAEDLDLYVAILNDIAKYSSSLALKLKNEFLKEAHNSLTAAAELFFDSWTTVIYLYPDEEQLKAHIQYDAAARTDLARVFYGDAPIIAKSLLRCVQ